MDSYSQQCEVPCIVIRRERWRLKHAGHLIHESLTHQPQTSGEISSSDQRNDKLLRRDSLLLQIHCILKRFEAMSDHNGLWSWQEDPFSQCLGHKVIPYLGIGIAVNHTRGRCNG